MAPPSITEQRPQSTGPRRATTRDVRRGNRSAVMRTLYLDGPMSRYELSQATGLSQATVSNLVGELLTEDLVVESGLVSSDGGRPRVMLTVNPSYGHIIGVDVGRTEVRVELFTLDLHQIGEAVLIRSSAETDIQEIVQNILMAVQQVILTAELAEADILGLGIGVPGIVERSSELIVHGQGSTWAGVPLVKLLAEGTNLPIFIDNGAKTMGQAELWWGAARGVRHAVMVLIGSGVGASIIAHGGTYRGASSSAGEWGHTTVHVGGRRCRCGARGCLEAYIGAGAILDRGYELAPELLDRNATQPIALAKLLSESETNSGAKEVLEGTVEYLGAGLANLINLFNPERLIIGGWAGLQLGRSALPAITAATKRQALQHPFADVTIELAALGTDAVALGAATLVVEQVLDGAQELGRSVSDPPQYAPQ